MKHKKAKLSAVLLFWLGLTGLQAQAVIPPTGGNASGNGGSVSYSVGQVFYTTNNDTSGNNGGDTTTNKTIGGGNGGGTVVIDAGDYAGKIYARNNQSLTLISPTNSRPTTSRPTFEWKTENAVEGVSYSIVVKELEEGKDIESGIILFERSDIRENTLPYPMDAPTLDPTKVYGWKVTAIQNGLVIVSTPFTQFTYVQGSVIWVLNGTTQLTSVSVGNVTGSAESISSGSGQFGMSIFDYSSDGQRLWEGTAGWIAGTEEASRYIQFNALPADGNSFTVTNVSFNYGAAGIDHNMQSNAYYSTDGWVTRTLLNLSPLEYPGSGMASFTQDVSVTIASGTTFSVRIYPYAIVNSSPMRPTFAVHNSVGVRGTTSAKKNCVIEVTNVAGKWGKSVYLTARLLEVGLVGKINIPNQVLQFYVDGIIVGKATTDANGFASEIDGVNVAGVHVIEVSFSGDANYYSQSGTGTLTIEKHVTSLVVAPTTAVFGQEVVLSATLTDNDNDGKGVSNQELKFYKISPGTREGDTARVYVGSDTTNLSGVTRGIIIIFHDDSGAELGIMASFAGDANYSPKSGTGTLTYTLSLGSICGVKFNDLNGDGVKDKNEPGISDWEISLSGSKDSTIYTNLEGEFCFTNLKPGAYTLSEQMRHGWMQTAPLSHFYTFQLAEGQNISGIEFGNMLDPCSSGIKVWSPLGTGVNAGVSAMAMMGGELYAGGYFTLAGGISSNYIAKWNGTSWSALGSGLNGRVEALAVIGTDLYVGGEFTTAGGLPANNIAKWDGANWSLLGTGTGGIVMALAVIGTDLYAGGWFNTAGGLSAKNIAKWDGVNWSALGSGLAGTSARVHSLAVRGTELFAGGSFVLSGSVLVKSIGKWDGANWSSLGNGINGDARALSVIGQDLYVAGDITVAWGNISEGILKWDGTNWSALGSGTNSSIWALTNIGPDLYAGGQFTTAGGVPANLIAKWDGSNWSAVGGGMTPSIKSLAVSGSDLYAGGQLTTAGGVSVNNIAKYSCSIPTSINYDKTIDDIPKRFQLEQNYPNPFNNKSTIGFNIPKTSFVSLSVYDIFGKEIKVFVHEEKVPGHYEIVFDSQEFVSGIYFYTLKTNEFSQSKKMILMK